MFARKNGDCIRGQSRPRPPASRRSGVEALESRRLLSTTLLDGVLTINGSMEADNVSVTMSGGDLLVNDLGFLKTLLSSTVTSVVVNLGLDNDTCTIDPSVILPVTIYGGAGNDVISGGSGNDTIYGAHPTITPNGADNDVIHGNGGDDVLIGGAGADAMNGGFGLDEVSYAAHGASVRVYLDGSANDGSSGEGDNVNGDVEVVRGSAFDDILNAPKRSNDVKQYGGTGQDLLDGG